MEDFDEFFGAFESGEPAEAPASEETPPAEETEQEGPATEEPETGDGGVENPESDDPAEEEDPQQDEMPADGDLAQEQTFTIQVDGESQTLNLEQITELAEKGASYDDLQARFEEAQQGRAALQQKIDEQQGIMDILAQLADRAKKPLQELVQQMYVNFRKSAGATETEAKQELEIAELKNAAKPAQADKSSGEDLVARFRRESAEFRKNHPGVDLNDALLAKIKPNVQKGMSLSNAYQKVLNDQKAAELAEQERKIAAEKQNAKNKAKSPGSQQDSGGRREKSGFEDFFAQFK